MSGTVGRCGGARPPTGRLGRMAARTSCRTSAPCCRRRSLPLLSLPRPVLRYAYAYVPVPALLLAPYRGASGVLPAGRGACFGACRKYFYVCFL